MQATIKVTIRHDSPFPVFPPGVDKIDSRSKIKIRGAFERQSAFTNVALVLRWVERDKHSLLYVRFAK
jgi:hypothetical protein